MYSHLSSLDNGKTHVCYCNNDASIILGNSAITINRIQPFIYNNENASELITRMDTETNSNRTRGIQDHSDKDFVLGALFPVHSCRWKK